MNTLKSTFPARTRIARLAAVAMLLGGVTVGALAQYKIVGPDGKVTYTDKPPTPQDIRPGGTAGTDAASGGMPYETRQAMSRYPVTLYSTKSCASCDQARQALRARGVPFNEYSVNTDADLAAFQSRVGGSSLPVIAIGGQMVKGYSSSDLASYLDAAGYPAQGRLTGYSWPAAQPLAPRSQAPTLASGGAAPAPAPAPSAPLLPPPSQSGIQF